MFAVAHVFRYFADLDEKDAGRLVETSNSAAVSRIVYWRGRQPRPRFGGARVGQALADSRDADLVSLAGGQVTDTSS
jgi:hypothetical protein